MARIISVIANIRLLVFIDMGRDDDITYSYFSAYTETSILKALRKHCR